MTNILEGMAILKEIKEDDVLIADGGFTCLKNLEEVTVIMDEDRSPPELYVPCTAGRHYLDGQWDEEEEAYVGFWKK